MPTIRPSGSLSEPLGYLRPRVLENDHIRLIVLPQCGGKIASIRDLRSGKNWLWHNPYLPFSTPNGTGRYVEQHDSGGWDECFPTIAPVNFPLPPWEGMACGDHGVLWHKAWRVVEVGNLVLELETDATPFGLNVRRRIMLSADQAHFRVQYELHGHCDSRFEFLWAVHPLFPLEAGGRLSISHGASYLFSHFEGPEPNLEGHAVKELPRVFHEFPSQSTRLCAKFFVTFNREPRVDLISPDGSVFRFQFPEHDYTGVAVWFNAGGWSGCGSPPYRNLAIEPMIGCCDDIAQAIGADLPRGIIDPGQTLRWELNVTLFEGKVSV